MNGSGIVRGGGYHYHATGFRCGRRMARANESSLGGMYIGFRLCEWCIKGRVLWWCNGGETEVC